MVLDGFCVAQSAKIHLCTS